MDEVDDNIQYGTPLEQLDVDSYYNQKIARRDEEIALDLQGRRRFHGAFTGGFSAGYFNSVGSKDGWTPSTFRSRKDNGSKKEQKHCQDPRDFMDEEDLQAHGIMPQVLRTTDKYSKEETSLKRKREAFSFEETPIPGDPVLRDLLRPVRISVGSRLLMKLGWRPGQGVGPRLSGKEKSKQGKRIYGCQQPEDFDKDESENVEDNEDDEIYSRVTFAPFEVNSNLQEAKVNTFGLGYKPLSRSNVLGHFSLFDSQPLKMTEKKKKVHIHGQAFGVGAFEDDDEDIYSKEDMSNYDFDLNSVKQKNNVPLENSFKAIGYISNHLSAFQISSKPTPKLKHYPLPQLPKDYVPKYKQRLRFERLEKDIRGLGRHDLSIEERRKLLAGSGNSRVEIRVGVKKDDSIDLTEDVPSTAINELSEVNRESAGASSKMTSGFKPFPNDDEKQKRYELYVRMKDKYMKDKFFQVQPNSLTEWEKEKERREFEKAHSLFRPLSFTMASRFTSAKSESISTLKAGLNNMEDSAPIIEELKSITPDRKVAAAQMENFGALTQVRVEWHPDPIICKRFNVPNAYPSSTFVGVVGSAREKPSIFNHLLSPMEPSSGQSSSTNIQNRPSRNCYAIDEIDNSEIEKTFGDKIDNLISEERNKDLESAESNYGLKVSTDGPPTLDLFKAIFENSDTESEEEKSSFTIKSVDSNINQTNNSLESCLNMQNTKEIFPPKGLDFNLDDIASKVQHRAFGIFKNIDFSELNRYRTEPFKNETVSKESLKGVITLETDSENEKSPNKNSYRSDENSDRSDDYMPPLPPHLLNKSQKETSRTYSRWSDAISPIVGTSINIPFKKHSDLHTYIEKPSTIRVKEKPLSKCDKKRKKKAKHKVKKTNHKSKKSKKSKKRDNKKKFSSSSNDSSSD